MLSVVTSPRNWLPGVSLLLMLFLLFMLAKQPVFKWGLNVAVADVVAARDCRGETAGRREIAVAVLSSA